MKQVTLLFGCLLSLAVLCIAAETADADDFDWMEELLDSGVDQGRNPPLPPNPVQMDEAHGQRWKNPPPPPNPVQMDEVDGQRWRNPPPPPNPVQMDEAHGQRWRNPPPPPNPVQMDEVDGQRWRNPPPPPNPMQMNEVDGQRWRNPPPPPNPVQMDEAHDNEEESNGTPSPEKEIPEDFLNEFDDEFNSDESNGDDTEMLQIQGLEEKLKLLSGVGRLIIGVGYNLLEGNPDGEGNSAADPGIQTGFKVLKTDYDDTVSDPIKVVPESDCSASKTVEVYSGTKGYQDALGVDVTAEGTVMMCTVIVIFVHNHNLHVFILNHILYYKFLLHRRVW